MQREMQEHERQAAQLEMLLQKVAEFPDPDLKSTTEEIIQVLLALYGEGLARILALVEQSGNAGKTLLEIFAQDDLLSSLFSLHGLHPVDLKTRIIQALAEIAPMLQQHSAKAELIALENGVASIRLTGGCQSCAMSSDHLNQMLEDTIFKAVPDLEEIQIDMDGQHPTRKTMPVMFIAPRRNKERLR